MRVCVRACAVAKQMQEQQLRARQMVLQQQAASATAAASKTQREVRAIRTRPPFYASRASNEEVHTLTLSQQAHAILRALTVSQCLPTMLGAR